MKRRVRRIFSGVADIRNKLIIFDFKKYEEYLKSEIWKESRKRFISKQKKLECFCCKLNTNLQVHHRTYARLGKEYLTDLVLLCGDCHKKTHSLAGLNPKNLYNAHRKLRTKLKKQLTLKKNT